MFWIRSQSENDDYVDPVSRSVMDQWRLYSSGKVSGRAESDGGFQYGLCASFCLRLERLPLKSRVGPGLVLRCVRQKDLPWTCSREDKGRVFSFIWLTSPWLSDRQSFSVLSFDRGNNSYHLYCPTELGSLTCC